MLEGLKRFFFSSMIPETREEDPEVLARELRLAACALLLELAYADREFTDDERQHVEHAVRRHWGLDEAQAAELLRLAEAERARATDLWQFTRLIRENYSPGQKMVRAEVMWGVVYSDGELSTREEYLLRKISPLLGLEVGYLSEARNRVRRGHSADGRPD
jgi:uncharacterized tellurite resistance protein B-like protein